MIETKTPSSRTCDARIGHRSTIILRPKAVPQRCNLVAASSIALRDELLADLVANATGIAQEQKREAEIGRRETEDDRARFARD